MSSLGRQIVVNPNVEAIHQDGVRLASIDHSFELALGRFNEANSLLLREAQEAAMSAGDITVDEPSLLLQKSRIDRDRQFTFARIGIRDADPELVKAAYLKLADSTDNDDRAARYVGANFFVPESWQYLQAEIGASAGLLGRLATVSLVMSGEDEGIPAAQAKDHYEEANKRTSGNNIYYAASNAMNAARHERIFGSNEDVLRWLRLASSQLRYANSSDSINVKAALRTIVARTGALRTPGSARATIFTRP